MSDLNSPPLAALAAKEWDLLIIGGGITGAGIMREAARLGQRVLLVEQGDFASGTSSRSAKLVHGGLQYLVRFQLGLVRESVRQREQLLRAGPGLVEPLAVLLATLSSDRVPANAVRLALGTYAMLAGQSRYHPRLSVQAVQGLAPQLSSSLVTGAFSYADAQTDDARLVLRVLVEGCRSGGRALNYVAATNLLREGDGRVIGARLQDGLEGFSAEVRARAVVNATGPWADGVRRGLGVPARLRLVRGSHLVIPRYRLPVGQAVVCVHPESGRPLYFVPWEGITLVGTTDVDHGMALDTEPRISPEEAVCLLRGAQLVFPSLHLERHDIQATFSGVRPIVDDRPGDPAGASRECALWEEAGLLTVTGGKLTTFRTTALRALKKLRRRLPGLGHPNRIAPALEAFPPVPGDLPMPTDQARRLQARYGPEGLLAIARAPSESRRRIPGLNACWEEFRWCARVEGVRHLDDLLLRRLRIGLTAPEGGLPWIGAMRAVVQPELGWEDARWRAETEAYREIWRRAYSAPEHWRDSFGGRRGRARPTRASFPPGPPARGGGNCGPGRR